MLMIYLSPTNELCRQIKILKEMFYTNNDLEQI